MKACVQCRVTGALKGVMALFSGFFTESIAVSIFASAYGCWRVSYILHKGPVFARLGCAIRFIELWPIFFPSIGKQEAMYRRWNLLKWALSQILVLLKWETEKLMLTKVQLENHLLLANIVNIIYLYSYVHNIIRFYKLQRWCLSLQQVSRDQPAPPRYPEETAKLATLAAWRLALG